MILADSGITSAPGRMMRSNSSSSHPLPTKCPGSLESWRCPLSIAPRGKTECPKVEMGPRWHRTGSPAIAVLDEKLSSSMVQCRIVPAGRISSFEAADAPTTETKTMRVRTRDFPAMVGLLVGTQHAVPGATMEEEGRGKG